MKRYWSSFSTFAELFSTFYYHFKFCAVVHLILRLRAYPGHLINFFPRVQPGMLSLYHLTHVTRVNKSSLFCCLLCIFAPQPSLGNIKPNPLPATYRKERQRRGWGVIHEQGFGGWSQFQRWQMRWIFLIILFFPTHLFSCWPPHPPLLSSGAAT